MIHVLRNCKAAKDVWRQVGGPARYPSFAADNLRQRLTRNIKFQVRNDFSPETWPVFFAIVTWWLWRWINCVVFGTTQYIPLNVNAFLMARFEETWRTLGDSVMDSNPATNARVETFVRWKAPPDGWMALNSDGAS